MPGSHRPLHSTRPGQPFVASQHGWKSNSEGSKTFTDYAYCTRGQLNRVTCRPSREGEGSVLCEPFAHCWPSPLRSPTWEFGTPASETDTLLVLLPVPPSVVHGLFCLSKSLLSAFFPLSLLWETSSTHMASSTPRPSTEGPNGHLPVTVTS